MNLFAVIDLTKASRDVPLALAYPFAMGCLILGSSFLFKSASKIRTVCFYLGLVLAAFSLLAVIVAEVLIGFISGMAAG